MNPENAPVALEHQPVSVRVKLSAAWTALVLLYAYVDILGFYTPGTVQDILDGRVHTFDLSQWFSTTALTFLSVPIFMVLLSLTLPSRASRLANLAVAVLYVPFTAYNLSGAEWLWFFGLGVALELVLLALILGYAWTWPREGAVAGRQSSFEGDPGQQM